MTTLAACLFASTAAHAHSLQFPIAGGKVLLKTSTTGSTSTFLFKSGNDPVIVASQFLNPATVGAAVLVKGTGPDGGSTGLIELDPQFWKGLGTPAGSKGYKYLDRTLSRGGIKLVLFKTGRIIVKATGSNWPWNMAAAQGSLEIQFRIEGEWYCTEFAGATARSNESGRFSAADADRPASCLTCGNGVLEGGEECDDGNLDDSDGCAANCASAACDGREFSSTFEAIQSTIFDNYSCNNGSCHAPPSLQGNMNLLSGQAYDQIVGVPSTIDPLRDRVEPGEQDLSILWRKLAANTLSDASLAPGSGMPVGSRITLDELEAVRLWIRAGAPAAGVVADTAELLDSCLPPPNPQKIPKPDPPTAQAGVQVVQTAYNLFAQSEREVCMPTYYDFSAPGIVPEAAKFFCGVTTNNPTGQCFKFHRQTLLQDPQSHHSIIHSYTGSYPVTDSGWGAWTYKSGAKKGQVCDPTDVDSSGINPDCSGSVKNSVACIFFFGPSDYSESTAPTFSGSQEPHYVQELGDGVYAVLPVQGIVVWNSHAFNLTATNTTMDQYLNLEFATAADQLYPARAIFDDGSIFTQNVPAFETREYCRTYTIPNGARLFHLSSHMHKRGVLWRTWAPPNASCSPGPNCTAEPAAPLYISTRYSDPLQLRFDPPMVLEGATNDRTFKFCATYDNGFTDPANVKRFSTSPTTGGLIPGGPCSVSQTRCIGGPNHNQLCNGDNSRCDSTTGAGDGDCDACPLRGGVTTEDEMFILLGTYFVP